MAERRFLAEVRELVDVHTAGGEYVSSVVAEQVLRQLQETDPELLDGFLHQIALSVLTQMVGDVSRSQRAHNRRVSRRVAVGKLLAAHEAGDTQPLTDWLATPMVINEAHEHKPLGDMVRQDLLFVAGSYRTDARRAQTNAAFFDALARQVGTKTVREVYTEQQIAEMFRNIDLAHAPQ